MRNCSHSNIDSKQTEEKNLSIYLCWLIVTQLCIQARTGSVQTDWLLVIKTADNEFKAYPLAPAYLWKARAKIIKEVDRHCVPWRGIRVEMKITCGSAEAKLAGFIKGSLFRFALRGIGIWCVTVLLLF